MHRRSRPRLRLRTAIVLGTSGAVAGLAACGASTSNAAHTTAGAGLPSVAASASASESATASASTSASASASASATRATAAAPQTTARTVATASSPGCATAKGSLPNSSITVCPAAAPVGAMVHVTIRNCADRIAGQPVRPAADLQFLGPDSWLGTGGGGGAEVRFTPSTGSSASATFTIPATYIGGNENPGPYPTLRTKPGTGYAFMTNPAGECDIHFTVLGSGS